jgi:hypothetical protein
MFGRKQLLGILAATGILFVWGMATHVGLHGAIDAIPVLKTAQEEQVMAAVQKPDVALADGVYMGSRGLFLVVNTLADGTDVFSGLSFSQVLIVQLFICGMVALLLSLIVGQLSGKSVIQRAALLGLMGLAAGLCVCLPQWTFYGFGLKLTIVNVVDIAGGWFLSGLVLARLAQSHSTAAVATSRLATD